MGGNYEVMHHTQFLKQLLKEGNLSMKVEISKENELPIMIPVIWDVQIKYMKLPRFDSKIRCRIGGNEVL